MQVQKALLASFQFFGIAAFWRLPRGRAEVSCWEDHLLSQRAPLRGDAKSGAANVPARAAMRAKDNLQATTMAAHLPVSPAEMLHVPGRNTESSGVVPADSRAIAWRATRD